jgi:hypothetical protein
VGCERSGFSFRDALNRGCWVDYPGGSIAITRRESPNISATSARRTALPPPRDRVNDRTTMRNETHQTADIDRNRTVVMQAREAQADHTGPPHASGLSERTGCPVMSRALSISTSWARKLLQIAGSDDRDRLNGGGFRPRVSASYLSSTAQYARFLVLRGQRSGSCRLAGVDPGGSPERHATCRVTTTRQAPVERTTLGCYGGQLTVLIANDGCGSDRVAPRSGDSGLHSIYGRTIGEGGTLQLLNTVGPGSQVRVSVASAIGP